MSALLILASLQGAALLSWGQTRWPLGHAALRPSFGVSMVATAEVKPTSQGLLPRNALASWELHKFGGASLATPELYKQCADLLISESCRPKEATGACVPTMAIVSAKGGVTDRLIKVVEAAMADIDESAKVLKGITAEQIEVVRELAGDEIGDEFAAEIGKDEDGILGVMRAVHLLRTIPPSTMELVTGYGEVWSAMTMHAYLRTQGVATRWLDARDVLIVEQTGGGGLGDKGSANTAFHAAVRTGRWPACICSPFWISPLSWVCSLSYERTALPRAPPPCMLRLAPIPCGRSPPRGSSSGLARPRVRPFWKLTARRARRLSS